MNYEYENSSSGSTFLEELTKANGEVLEARDRIPYQPVVYAIPEEWRKAEKELLEQAVQFQPNIYRTLQTLATRQELEQMQTTLAQTLRAEKLETLRSIQTTLEQAGSEIGKSLSEWSKAQSESNRALAEQINALEKKCTKLLIAGVSASAVVSVLCLVLLRLVM